MDDRNDAESTAWELVTAALIARDEASDPDDVQTKDEAQAWLRATAPLTDLAESAVDRITDGDIDFGLDLIYELAGLMATSMEAAAAIRKQYAGKTVVHDEESADLTGLRYWQTITQRRIEHESD
jgi:hypothetical protein